ncbi:transmembrane protein 71 isoform 2-T2 [Discoglossus pictus]
MEEVCPLMSTPVSAKHSPFLRQASSDLPSKLFEFYPASDSFELTNTETPENSFLNPAVSFSPSRHSPRLLANGYYVLDEDSYSCDENGNVSLTPTKSTVSYKENLTRIFRKRRKLVISRRLPLWSNEENLATAEEDILELDQGGLDNSYNFNPDDFTFSYDIKKWMSAEQPEPQVHASDKTHPVDNASVPLTSFIKDVCIDTSRKKEVRVWKRRFHHVTLLSVFLFISLWARLLFSELFATLLTYMLVITLICLTFSPARRKIQNKIS